MQLKKIKQKKDKMKLIIIVENKYQFDIGYHIINR